jgi:hypothetical protein
MALVSFVTSQPPDLGVAQPSSPAEKSGLNKVMWYGIIQIVSLVAGWAVSFLIFGTIFASTANLNIPANATPQQLSSALGPLFQIFALIIPLLNIVAPILILVGANEAKGRLGKPM